MRAEVRALPEVFLERLKHLVPSSRWDQIANTFAAPPPTTFRINTLKTTPEAVREALEAQGLRVRQVPWSREAYLLVSGRLRDLQETALYRQGAIYVQSLASMLPALVLAPQPGETILDLTAAPGSKTTQMACLMQGRGRIVANDNNRVRFFKLKANVESQGVTNVELSLKPGETFGRTHPDTFDRVLLDAPCSAEGRFQAHEPASYRYWKPAKIREMARKQKRLLGSAIGALRSGGVLVYSTCTFAPEENEAVVDWALRRFPGVCAIEEIQFDLPNRMAGLVRWDAETFDPGVHHGLRILPTDEMEGFFIARLRKLKSVTIPPFRSQ